MEHARLTRAGSGRVKPRVKRPVSGRRAGSCTATRAGSRAARTGGSRPRSSRRRRSARRRMPSASSSASIRSSSAEPTPCAARRGRDGQRLDLGHARAALPRVVELGLLGRLDRHQRVADQLAVALGEHGEAAGGEEAHVELAARRPGRVVVDVRTERLAADRLVMVVQLQPERAQPVERPRPRRGRSSSGSPAAG